MAVTKTKSNHSRRSSSPSTEGRGLPEKEVAAKTAARKAKAGGAKKGSSASSPHTDKGPMAQASRNGSRTAEPTAGSPRHDDGPAASQPSSSTAPQATSTKKTGKSSSRSKARELEEQLARVQALYKHERAKRKKLQKRANKNADAQASGKITRPKGSAGDNYSLQTAMGLKDKRETYLACRPQLAVKRCVDRAGLDENIHMRNQDVLKLGLVYKAAREANPYLKQFAQDWATFEFVRMLLRNRRQQNRKRARRAAQEEAAADDEDDEEEDDQDDDEDEDDGSGSDEDESGSGSGSDDD
ncbi:hypothetical protein AURDEDRAFT_131867 [Auricularia subglabra TFB-10046 SS5]|uniref:Uncharacterized protein n=1 Tax=Auricularia subglabra (strain TFB-10046 / SS5) TaxID=717982 RepID=J0L9N6_AURST|nr:hypothetical protein AURDEDRAFT_131867 [Auricularia subglabra TFB-10046 SS5]